MKPIKRRDLIGMLEQAGFTFLREGGDHSIYLCPCKQHRVPVPRHKEIRPGVVNNINKVECMKGWLS